MKPRSKKMPNRMELREQLLGAGLESMRKSYYPALQEQLKQLQEQSAALLRMVRELEQARREIEQLNQELEARVVLRTRELQATNQDLEAFTYMVSHDLQAPLRHISSFAKLLQHAQETPVKESNKFYTDQIIGSAAKMASLIRDLLNFSKAGRAALHRAAVDLGEMVREVQQELQADWPGRDIVWQLGPFPVVNADRALLRQVLLNLIANALKYTQTRSQSRIHVGAQASDTEHVVFVRDNGVGFDPQAARQLFQLFQRLHSAEEFSGSGIGLASVARIISRHGGNVWAEASLGQGACFFFSLPKS
ncbi:MAG TPA: ATP-binding protein [Tepidisphaeraceae bacterium]|nr:ATP-binding protein [Tepidisphaeraceae bacterium]